MTVPADGNDSRNAARRAKLFGRPVASFDRPELIRWLRKFTNAHPNPTGRLAREARRWLVELERCGDQEPVDDKGDP